MNPLNFEFKSIKDDQLKTDTILTSEVFPIDQKWNGLYVTKRELVAEYLENEE